VFCVSFFYGTIVYNTEWDVMEYVKLALLLAVIGAIILVVPAAILTWIQGRRIGDTQFTKEIHWFLLFLFSVLIFETIGCGSVNIFQPKLATSNEFRRLGMIIVLALPPNILYALHSQDEPDLLPYCPAIVDIYDGIEIIIMKLNPTNPVWVHITICLAVIMYYIPSFLEIYHLKFPELTNGSIFSERRVRLGQFVSSCVFLVLRVVLFAYYPQEIVFVFKSIVRVYYHYKKLQILQD
jgi:hypothetical protein